jgi:hypothetical protein
MTHHTRTKKCAGPCHTRKMPEDFHHKTEALDGRQAICRECSRIARMARGRKANARTNQSSVGEVETLYVSVPAEVKAKIVVLAVARNASQAATVAALLRGALANVEARYGPLDMAAEEKL